ncbi:hypothetical protein SprV_0501924300 [Sparganum proliferum]
MRIYQKHPTIFQLPNICGLTAVPLGQPEEQRASSQFTDNELAQRLVDIPVAAATDKNASLANQWGQMRDMVQSVALAVLGRARCQHQDRSDDKDTANRSEKTSPRKQS